MQGRISVGSSVAALKKGSNELYWTVPNKLKEINEETEQFRAVPHAMNLTWCQEEVDAKIAEQENSSSSSSSSQSDSESSGSSSQLRLPGKGKEKAKAKAKEAKKPQTRKRAKAEKGDKDKAEESGPVHGKPGADQKPLDAPASAEPFTPTPSQMEISSGVATPSGSAKDRESSRGLTTMKEKAQAALRQLQLVTPPALWSQGIKAKDMDTRFQRAVDLASKLQSKAADSASQDLAVQLETEVNRVSKQHDLLRGIQEDCLAHVEDKKADICALASDFGQEQYMVFLTDIAKRLVEDCDWIKLV